MTITMTTSITVKTMKRIDYDNDEINNDDINDDNDGNINHNNDAEVNNESNDNGD